MHAHQKGKRYHQQQNRQYPAVSSLNIAFVSPRDESTICEKNYLSTYAKLAMMRVHRTLDNALAEEFKRERRYTTRKSNV